MLLDNKTFKKKIQTFEKKGKESLIKSGDKHSVAFASNINSMKHFLEMELHVSFYCLWEDYNASCCKVNAASTEIWPVD